jgi:hypothetical protein
VSRRECRIPGIALTCALSGREASKCYLFMIEILLPTDKILTAKKSWGVTPVGAEARKLDGSSEGISRVLLPVFLPSAIAVCSNKGLETLSSCPATLRLANFW